MHYPHADWFNESYLESLYALLDALGGTAEKEALQSTLAQYSNNLEELQVEYTRLFINGIPHVAAPPYASVYLDKTLRGRYSDELLTHYRSAGFVLNEKADLPDNIIHQLEFLSFLAEDNDPEGEKIFLTRFFSPWFPIFSLRVREKADHPFYRIIISLIDFFTKEEEEYGVQLNEA